MKKLIFPIILFAIALVSCQSGPMKIDSAKLCKKAGGTLVEVPNKFSPTDGPFHLEVIIVNAPVDTRVKAVWTAVDAAGTTNEKIDEKEVKTTMNLTETIDFFLELPRDWPTGTYKVELLVNDVADRTVEFTVE